MIFHNHIAFISGLYSGAINDRNVFCRGLKHRISDKKLVIADQRCQTRHNDEKMLSLPSLLDHPNLYVFESQACLCHETLNDRIHFFKCMSDTFRNGEKLGIAFEAVAVIMPCQMDKGEEIFFS
eukprot:15366071-Ditylum_brightwellii.AAC.1